MQDQNFSVNYISSVRDVGEYCQLTLAHSKLLVLIEGSSVLQCLSIDDIEAVLTAEVVGVEPRHALCLLRTVDGSPDLVCLLDDVKSSRAVVDAIHAMRKARQARGISLPKFIEYQHQGVSEVHALLEPDGLSVVKWKKGVTAPMPPFPHSRLDFLRLHLNKSVMQKVSSFGDTLIDLSCDNVAACGTLVSECGDKISDGLVLLLTDRNLYLTKPSGVLVTRVEIRSICSARMANQHELVLSLLVGKELSLRCRYCHEIAHRVRPIAHDTGRVLPSDRSRDVTSASTQTEATSSDDQAHAPSLYHLQLLLKNAEDELQEKSAMIELQRARIDSLSDKLPKGLKLASNKSRDLMEVDILRHYASMLEVECDRLRNDSGSEPAAQDTVPSALTESRSRIHKLEVANQRLTGQLEELSRSFQRSVEESTSKALTSVRTFIRTLEKRWMAEKKNIAISYPQQGIQYKRLREMNAKLIDELRDRDRLIEDLVTSDDPSSNFPRYFADRQKKIEDASATLDTLTVQITSLEGQLEAMQAKVALEAAHSEAVSEEAAVSSKIAGALSGLTLQAARVANLEAMLLQSTQKKIDVLQLQEKVRFLEKENATLRMAHRRKPVAKTLAARSPRSPDKQAQKLSNDDRSRVVSLSPLRDDAARLHEELEAQRIAFERRLQGLESIAFSSHASMGVVEPMLPRHRHSPSKHTAVIEAQNILLRSQSPRRRDSALRTVR
jgi:hypothetical protein